MKPKNVKEIVVQYLKKNGYDGLVSRRAGNRIYRPGRVKITGKVDNI